MPYPSELIGRENQKLTETRPAPVLPGFSTSTTKVGGLTLLRNGFSSLHTIQSRQASLPDLACRTGEIP